ncbi:MAG: hypothetical protein K2G31_06040 [Clostridia bacterium]|nr:hypothetical protein [Clostridia bacterium]
MDTLTLFIRILDGVVQGAKAVGLLAVLFLMLFTVKSMRLSRMLSNVATVCLLVVIAASSIQHACFAAFGDNRFITILFSLTNGVTLFLVLVTAVCCLDSLHHGFVVSKIAFWAQYNNGFQKCVKHDDARYISSSYLETTPILLA